MTNTFDNNRKIEYRNSPHMMHFVAAAFWFVIRNIAAVIFHAALILHVL